jgi:hypothetical protein
MDLVRTDVSGNISLPSSGFLRMIGLHSCVESPYRPSARSLPVKLVSNFAGRGCDVVSATGPRGPQSRFSRSMPINKQEENEFGLQLIEASHYVGACGIGGLAPVILTFRTKGRCAVNFMSLMRSIFCRGE